VYSALSLISVSLSRITVCETTFRFVKGHRRHAGRVYLPPLPMSLKELRDRITHALQTITADMLPRVWDEFDYRVDVRRVTQGAHIEGF
jgi:hypothetical protein